jgi:hypothetical protein
LEIEGGGILGADGEEQFKVLAVERHQPQNFRKTRPLYGFDF